MMGGGVSGLQVLFDHLYTEKRNHLEAIKQWSERTNHKASMATIRFSI